MSCGCKGVRTCLLCEGTKGIFKQPPRSPLHEYYLCAFCGRITSKDTLVFKYTSSPICHVPCHQSFLLQVPDHVIHGDVHFGGITLVNDFISPLEEEELTCQIDSSPWVESQSGRQKQDYGPKVNFKKQKIRYDTFMGLPPYCRPYIERLNDTIFSQPNPFKPVELCNLDYQPDRGASIDPHTDDTWLWGERLITLNLLSSTYLTFSHPHHDVVVRVPLPRRSLIVVEGIARQIWEHGIHRHHILSRRIAMTFRELSQEFCPGGNQEEMGKTLLAIANTTQQ